MNGNYLFINWRDGGTSYPKSGSDEQDRETALSYSNYRSVRRYSY